MTQSRKGSLVESLTNVAIGYVINITANTLIFPLFGWEISLRQNVTLGLFYTAISIARSYVLRRWFNARIARAAAAIGGRLES